MARLEIPRGSCGLADQIERIPRLLTAAELAGFLNVSRMTIYRDVQSNGGPPAIFVRGSIRFDPKAVARWLRGDGRAA